mmetsp:Transcript_29991/g.48858  ORF Transcript_29991/g.48858 Transcript_29991/m.48858 type:complete len:232 (+) Transcript_29991:349-1044(+)
MRNRHQKYKNRTLDGESQFDEQQNINQFFHKKHTKHERHIATLIRGFERGRFPQRTRNTKRKLEPDIVHENGRKRDCGIQLEQYGAAKCTHEQHRRYQQHTVADIELCATHIPARVKHAQRRRRVPEADAPGNECGVHQHQHKERVVSMNDEIDESNQDDMHPKHKQEQHGFRVFPRRQHEKRYNHTANDRHEHTALVQKLERTMRPNDATQIEQIRQQEQGEPPFPATLQ